MECTRFSFKFSGVAVCLGCVPSNQRDGEQMGTGRAGLVIVREKIIIIFEQW